MSCGNTQCPDHKEGHTGNCTWRTGRYDECADYTPAQNQSGDTWDQAARDSSAENAYENGTLLPRDL